MLAAAPGQTELDLLAGSLRPEGRAELERNAGPIDRQPLYQVEAELDPARLRVRGKLRIVVTNREPEPLRDLVLRIYPAAGRRAGTSMRVEDVRLDGRKAAATTRGSVVEIALPAPLGEGARAAVTLAFHGKLRRLGRGEDDLLASALPGLGKPMGAVADGHGTFAVSAHGAALVDWYPQLASRSARSWDRSEPGRFGDPGRAEPASAVVALTVPKGWRVAGAGTALGQRRLPDGREIATFAAAGVRGPLGVAASPYYVEAKRAEGAVQLRASSLHGEAGARALLDCGAEALRELERRFGPYPWKDLALGEAALSGGAGGVEMPGLALVARSLGGAGLGQLLDPPLFKFTCWHEVAHQWWQAVVGSDPRAAPWVDEALAQYSATLVAEAAAPEAPSRQAGRDALARHVALNYQGMRAMGTADGKVARPVEAFPSLLSYAGLVYGKAPLFFDRVRELLGDAKFDAAVRAYRGAWAFREAGPASFLQAAGQTSPEHAQKLAALERRWLYESHGDEDIGPLDPSAILGGSGLAAMPRLMTILRGLGRQPGTQPDGQDMQELIGNTEKLMSQIRQMMDQLGVDQGPADDSPPEE